VFSLFPVDVDILPKLVNNHNSKNFNNFNYLRSTVISHIDALTAILGTITVRRGTVHQIQNPCDGILATVTLFARHFVLLISQPMRIVY